VILDHLLECGVRHASKGLKRCSQARFDGAGEGFDIP
jgi:hypothetical protein